MLLISDDICCLGEMSAINLSIKLHLIFKNKSFYLSMPRKQNKMRSKNIEALFLKCTFQKLKWLIKSLCLQ